MHLQRATQRHWVSHHRSYLQNADGSLSPTLEADDGTLSPQLMQLGDDDDADIEIVDESADLAKLQERRQKVNGRSEVITDLCYGFLTRTTLLASR